jgi:hypothetical protein
MDPLLFMAFICFYEQETRGDTQRNRRKKALLSDGGKQRRDRRIPRASLLMPWDSPWEKVLFSANDQSLITMTGFDCQSFHMLHRRFCIFFNRFSPHTGEDGRIALLQRRIGGQYAGTGRKRIVTSEACLGLLLVFNRTTAPCHMLSCLFGISGTAVSVYVRFARLILLRLLKHHPTAKVALPTNEKVAEYKQAISSKYPRLKNVYCVCDGLKIDIQAAGQFHEQIHFYNGWQKSHCISNLFVFVPDGTIIAVALNCPGVMHDSYMADLGYIYSKLEEVNERVPHGAQCVMDSAFCGVGKPYVIKSIQAIHRAVTAEEYLMLEEATSMRQAAEWGMNALKSSFARLKATMRYEVYGERSQILQTIVLLYNWRANTVGVNQIKTVFMPHLNQDVDQYILNL